MEREQNEKQQRRLRARRIASIVLFVAGVALFAVCAAVFCGVQAIRRGGGLEGIALIAYLPILFGACILATVVHGVCIAVSARAKKAYPRSSIVFIVFSAAFIAVYAVFLGLLFLD